MPVDQKRINGPEGSTPYNIYINNKPEHADTQEQIFKPRQDGRANNHLRQIFVKTGVISQAKGSAYIEMGKTKVICSVFDPREIPNKNDYSMDGDLFCDFKFAPFSCSKRRVHQQDSEEKEFSLVMQRALEPAVRRHEFPNFQVDVYALVLDNGGSSLAAAIMAASLALADASVPMFGLVTAVTMGVQQHAIFLDPTDEEEILCNAAPSETSEYQNHGLMMQATLLQHEQISEFFLVGSIDMKCIKSAIESLTAASKDICSILQKCLVKSVINAHKRKEREEKEMTE